MKISKYFISLGMLGVLLYFLHTILGNALWNEYNPITMDISSLTADGAPNSEVLRVITFIYGVCMILMVTGLIIKSFKEYTYMLRVGFIILLIMQTTSAFGYSLFPLTGDKTQMNFQNMMHIIVTIVVVFTTIISSFVISFGYFKEKNKNSLGKFSLVMAILITLFGAFNPISINLQLNILGLTERLVVYTMLIFMFVLSFYYTFIEKKTLNKSDIIFNTNSYDNNQSGNDEPMNHRIKS